MIGQKHTHTQPRMQWWLAALGISLMLFLSACGTLTPKGQSAQQEKARLDSQIQQALKLGVPEAQLTPIRTQEAKLTNQLGTPGIFGDSTPDTAYGSAITSYQVLESEVSTVIAQVADMRGSRRIRIFKRLIRSCSSARTRGLMLRFRAISRV